MFGHQDDLAYGVGWKRQTGRSDVKDVTGSYPAVFGWDVSKLGRPFNIDSVNFEDMKRWIKKVYQMGGINTISWHMDNPVTGGDAWDKTPAVHAILPGGNKHDFYKKRLDLFAEFIKELQTVGGVPIPVIFRPFHELTGNWFWWGKGNCTKDDFVALWRFTVDYLENVKGVHQLLYCYSTDKFNSKEQYLEFYPGDDYVDILAVDDYQNVKSVKGRKKLVYELKTVVELAGSKGKIAALSETGLESIPVSNWFTGILLPGIKADETGKCIAYVLVWRNARPEHHYAPYPGHPAAADFVKFRDDPYTLFLDDLPDMYKSN
jgi:mannan endo-1,4-beta-mannosidase